MHAKKRCAHLISDCVAYSRAFKSASRGLRSVASPACEMAWSSSLFKGPCRRLGPSHESSWRAIRGPSGGRAMRASASTCKAHSARVVRFTARWPSTCGCASGPLGLPRRASQPAGSQRLGGQGLFRSLLFYRSLAFQFPL